MRRITTIFLAVMLAVFAHTAVSAAPVPPRISAEAAVVLVAKTRQVLYDKNADAIMYPASTTKMITAITAIERGKLDSIVIVSPRAANCEGSRLELTTGDRLKLEELLYGMMLPSGNDAAVAVAEHIAGSVPKFVEMMNDEADRIGTTKTHFSNPHGLPDPNNHFSTAHDLALIAAYALQNPEFARIVGTNQHTVDLLNRSDIFVENTNMLLASFKGATGVKTGFTNAAGECLVASAQRGGVTLIAVVLNDNGRWNDAARLLDYGFRVAGVSP